MIQDPQLNIQRYYIFDLIQSIDCNTPLPPSEFVSLPFWPLLHLKYRHSSATCLHSTNSSYVALKWMRRNLRVIFLNEMGLKWISGNVSSVSPNRCDVKYSKRIMLLLCWLMMTSKKATNTKMFFLILFRYFCRLWDVTEICSITQPGLYMEVNDVNTPNCLFFSARSHWNVLWSCLKRMHRNDNWVNLR